MNQKTQIVCSSRTNNPASQRTLPRRHSRFQACLESSLLPSYSLWPFRVYIVRLSSRPEPVQLERRRALSGLRPFEKSEHYQKSSLLGTIALSISALDGRIRLQLSITLCTFMVAGRRRKPVKPVTRGVGHLGHDETLHTDRSSQTIISFP